MPIYGMKRTIYEAYVDFDWNIILERDSWVRFNDFFIRNYAAFHI